MIPTAFISAQDAIKTLCLRNEDTNFSKAAIYTSYLQTVYNELRLDVTHTSKIAKFQLNKFTKSLAIPEDCMLLYGVGYVDDCGVVQPLWYNTKIPQEILFENGQPCDCDSCTSEHANCNVIDTVDTVEEIVVYNDTEYTKTTKTITLKDGTILKRVNTPTLISSTDEIRTPHIEMIETTTELCKLELLPCGCVANTTTNAENIQRYDCGCWNFVTNCGTYNKFKKKEYGWTMDITGSQIIMDSSYPYNYVVLKYAASISSAKDYKIPILSLEALLAGIMYYYDTNNPRSAPYLKGVGGMRYNQYFAEKKKLSKRLRPTNFQRALGAMGVVADPHCENQFAYYNRYWVGRSCCI